MGEDPNIKIKLKAGDIVRIRKYAVNPDFWDSHGDMYKLGGTIQVVNLNSNDMNYYLEGLPQWTWRRRDLILITTDGAHDPNIAFRIIKRSKRGGHRGHR